MSQIGVSGLVFADFARPLWSLRAPCVTSHRALGGSERGAGLRVGAQAAVGHRVVLGPRADLCAPREPLADEPRLLEASLLGHVLHVRLGLDAVEVRVGEEPVRELTLRIGSEAPTAGFRAQLDPDVPRVGFRVRPEAHPVPPDSADGRPIGDSLDHEHAVVLVAERTRPEEVSRRAARSITEVVELAPGCLVRIPRVEQIGVSDRDVTQPDARGGVGHDDDSLATGVIAPKARSATSTPSRPEATGMRTWLEPATGRKPASVRAVTTAWRAYRAHLSVTRPGSTRTSGTRAASAAMRTATAVNRPSTGPGIGPNRSRSSARSASPSAPERIPANRPKP